MASEAKIRISIIQREIEISGSEQFVREQIEYFKDYILKSMKILSEPADVFTCKDFHRAEKMHQPG